MNQFNSFINLQKGMSIRITHSHIKEAISVKEYSYAQNKNFPARQYMEDSIFLSNQDFIALDNFPSQQSGLFAILDGHGGAKVSEYCVQAIPRLFDQFYKDEKNEKKSIDKILQKVCKKIDKKLVEDKIDADDIGSTCCIAFVTKIKNQKYCTVGNLGDTRAVLYQGGNTIRMTTDHKGTNQKEKERISKQKDGCIINGRVGGQLAVTRALGDLAFKSIGLSNEPQVKEFRVNQKQDFMIIASDGLWDVCDDTEATELVKDMPSTKEMSKRLMQQALKKGSKDNISVLVVKF